MKYTQAIFYEHALYLVFWTMDVQSQNAVTAYLSNKQLLLFAMPQDFWPGTIQCLPSKHEAFTQCWWMPRVCWVVCADALLKW